LIEQEELSVEPTEVEAEIEEMLEPLGERGDQLREMFNSPNGRMSVTERLLTGKAVERLKAIARGEEPAKGKPPPEAAEEAAAGAKEGSEAGTPEAETWRQQKLVRSPSRSRVWRAMGLMWARRLRKPTFLRRKWQRAKGPQKK
jgi:hypothetical protein